MRNIADVFAEIRARGEREDGPPAILRIPHDVRERELLLPRYAEELLYSWEAWARPKQLEPPGDWLVWLLLGGRGMGKTRTGAEWIRSRVMRGAESVAIVGTKFGDVEQVMLGLAGTGSGLLEVFPPHQRPEWRPHKRELRFHTGAIGYAYSAEDTELRGPNIDTAWCDEPIKWPYVEKLWDNLLLALRVRTKSGLMPRACVTTTPRQLRWLRELILDPETHTTHGKTHENAGNIPQSVISGWQRRWGGTRQGLQELEAELLDDREGALFSRSVIEAHAVRDMREVPKLVRSVVAVDPAVSLHRKSDATGIVVLGADASGEVYVLRDATARYTPEEWGDLVIDLCERYEADGIVVERNRAGDLVAMNVRAAAARKRRAHPPIIEVLALGDKGERAQPVSTLYEKGSVHHVGHLVRERAGDGEASSLEEEMCEWDARSTMSPNGLDALVHGIIELTGIGREPEPKRPDARKQWSGIVSLAARVPPSNRGML